MIGYTRKVGLRKPGTFEWARSQIPPDSDGLAEWIAYQESVLNQDQVESLRQWWHGYETRLIALRNVPYDQGGLLEPISRTFNAYAMPEPADPPPSHPAPTAAAPTPPNAATARWQPDTTGGFVKCVHEAWEESASSRKCADCGQWLEPIVKPAADFQVGDRVSVEGVVTHVFRDAVSFKPSTSEVGGWSFPKDCLTLVERPKRKLRVGSVWERIGMHRYVAVGLDRLAYVPTIMSLTPPTPEHRSALGFDTDPQDWREVPVEELAREVEP